MAKASYWEVYLNIVKLITVLGTTYLSLDIGESGRMDQVRVASHSAGVH